MFVPPAHRTVNHHPKTRAGPTARVVSPLHRVIRTTQGLTVVAAPSGNILPCSSPRLPQLPASGTGGAPNPRQPARFGVDPRGSRPTAVATRFHTEPRINMQSWVQARRRHRLPGARGRQHQICGRQPVVHLASAPQQQRLPITQPPVVSTPQRTYRLLIQGQLWTRLCQRPQSSLWHPWCLT